MKLSVTFKILKEGLTEFKTNDINFVNVLNHCSFAEFKRKSSRFHYYHVKKDISELPIKNITTLVDFLWDKEETR